MSLKANREQLRAVLKIVLSAFAVAVAGLIGIQLAANASHAEETCANYAHLLEEIVAGSTDNEDPSIGEQMLLRIDEAVTEPALNSIFDCLFTEHPAIGDFFGAEPYIIDSDVFQFAASESAFGKILVSKQHSEDYLAEKSTTGLRVLKISFDFNTEGYPFVDEFVGFHRASADENIFVRLGEQGYFRDDEACLKCHSTKQDELFFKSGFEHQVTTK